MIEVYIHIQRLKDFSKGRPVNVKVNYADQYDIKMMINPRKYIITTSRESINILTIRRKRLKDYILRTKNF